MTLIASGSTSGDTAVPQIDGAMCGLAGTRSAAIETGGASELGSAPSSGVGNGMAASGTTRRTDGSEPSAARWAAVTSATTYGIDLPWVTRAAPADASIAAIGNSSCRTAVVRARERAARPVASSRSSTITLVSRPAALGSTPDVAAAGFRLAPVGTTAPAASVGKAMTRPTPSASPFALIVRSLVLGMR